MSLLGEYNNILNDYDQVLILSRTILSELENEGSPVDILTLLEQKQVVARNIARLTDRISATEITSGKDPNLQDLAGVKILLSQIVEKTKQIMIIEDKIQKILTADNPG